MQRASTRFLVSTLVIGLGFAGALAGCGDDDDNSNQNQSQIIPREDVLKACLISDACEVMPFLYASLCVEANWDQQWHTGTIPVWNELYACALENAGSCDQVRACFGGGVEPPACGSVTDGYCDGSTRVFCDTFDAKLYSQNCALANQTCVMAEVAIGIMAPVCGLGECLDGHAAECRGNLLVKCDQGAILIRDCSAFGLVCGNTVQGDGKACTGNGSGCDSNTIEPSCEGTVLRRCVENKLSSFDCATLPGDKTCEPGRDQCVSAGTQCESGQESCQGSTIRVCIDGNIQEIDCLELGYTRCELTAGGAHCRG